MYQQKAPGSAVNVGQGGVYMTKQIPTIYKSNGVTESREVLAENGYAHHAIPGSTRSLPVVREQYCLCTPTTRLEKRLTIAVIVLTVLVVLLLIGISILADQLSDEELKKFVHSFTNKV